MTAVPPKLLREAGLTVTDSGEAFVGCSRAEVVGKARDVRDFLVARLDAKIGLVVVSGEPLSVEDLTDLHVDPNAPRVEAIHNPGSDAAKVRFVDRSSA